MTNENNEQIIICEKYIDELIDHNPKKLIQHIHNNDLGDAYLSYALQNLGHTGSPPISLLLKHLKHPKALVREGAVYGLNVVWEKITYHLLSTFKNDESKAVQECVFDIFEDDIKDIVSVVAQHKKDKE